MNREEQLLYGMAEAAKEAGQIMLEAEHIGEGVRSKEGHANYVTVYDGRVQAFLEEKLLQLSPGARFVGEEDGQEVFLPEYREGLVYVIDPIDGTTNFMNGYRLSTVSIGLLKDGVPYAGVVYNPYSGECFQAMSGHGAYLNGTRIHSSGKGLSDSLVLVGTSPYNEELRKRTFRMSEWYFDRCADLRRNGSAAYELCLLAAGRAGLYFELMLGLWDFTAGAVILQEAGGRITDPQGNPLTFDRKSGIVAVSEGIARETYLPEGGWETFFQKGENSK